MAWLSMGEAAKEVGPRRAGKPTCADTVRQWVKEGLRGVKLRGMMRGGILVTSREWLDEFFAAYRDRRDRDEQIRKEVMRRIALTPRDRKLQRRATERVKQDEAERQAAG